MPIHKTSGSAFIRFRDLAVGQHFRVKGAAPGLAAKKTSRFCYVGPTRKSVRVKRHGRITGKVYSAYVSRAGLWRNCFRSASGLDTLVQPTGRRSPVRKRKGRARGAATLGGLRRSK